MPDRVLAFDLFGTLLHGGRPRQTHREVAEAIALQTGVPLNAVKRTVYPAIMETRDPARRQRQVEKALQEEGQRAGLAPEDVATVTRSYIEQVGHAFYQHEAVPHAELALALAHKSGHEVVIISNCMTPRSEVTQMLEDLDLLWHVDHLFLSSDGHGKKPDVEWFAAIAAHLGVRPSACHMVGDDPRLDIDPARAAGWGASLVDATAASWDALSERLSVQHNNGEE